MNPPTADSLNRTGAELFLRGDVPGARLHYAAALQRDPGFFPAMANLAQVENGENRLIPAKALYARLIAELPRDHAMWNNYGNTLSRLELFEQAEAAFERAVELAPDDTAAWHNRMLCAMRQGDAERAREYYSRLRSLGANSPSLQNDYAHVLLYDGSSLGSALEAYEARWAQMSHLPPWDFHIPEWKGESLDGKRILLHGEQGFGDTIMTIRFAQNLTLLGATVWLAIPKGLVSLIEAQQWPFVHVLSTDDLLDGTNWAEQFDFHSPLYSAMRWLEIERKDINPVPYLTAPPISVPPVNPAEINVGICWASGTRGGAMDWRRRHAPLEHWAQLFEVPRVRLWSLQVGDERNDIEEAGLGSIVSDRTKHFADWSDTAAFIAQLDLVISVDTAVVHLAGAMGKPVWMLAQFVPCWRWWGNPSGEPWYSQMQIIRQSESGNWHGQLSVARDMLAKHERNAR